jgi:hypothetical protein
MPQLEVTLKARQDQDVIPGEFVIEATFTNVGREPTRFNLHQASHAALVLDLRDHTYRPVFLGPPSGPDKEDLGPGEVIAPSESVTLIYAGFIDRSMEAGNYRVRYFSPHSSLGGSRDDPLKSEWLHFTVRSMKEFARAQPLGPAGPYIGETRLSLFFWFYWWWHWLICFIRRLIALIFGRRWCDRVLSREVDEARTETISNAPPGAEAWNGTYSWRARFLVTVDEASCRVTVTVRVRISGAITAAQTNAWETAIENAWSNRFKLCCPCCCCGDGYAIVGDIQFVVSGEHQVVNAGASTANMGNWGVNDTVDVNHEFGHMLGALDEYFTVNGVDFNGARQPGGNIMNNPANAPAARHYDLVRDTVRQLLGSNCVTRAVGERC